MTLDEMYEAAEQDNIFFVEYQGLPAAAGDLRDLIHLAEENGEVSVQELLNELVAGAMGAIIDLTVLGSVHGEDRVANCQSAWDMAKEARADDYLPRTVGAREALGLRIGTTKPIGTFTSTDFGGDGTFEIALPKELQEGDE